MPSISSVFFFVGALVLHVSAQQIPSQLIFPFTSQSVNGSSATGHCTGATRLSDRYQCNDSTSSVVYDGIIPTLTGLDGNMWASRLLTINASSAVLVFNFTGTPNFQVMRVEMVVFNCQQWGISLQSVVLTNSALTQLGAVNPTLSSCDSLVRVCIPNITSSQLSVLRLEFRTRESTGWIHIAEVGFYGNSDICPPEIIIPETTTATTLAATATTSTTEITDTTAIYTTNQEATPTATINTSGSMSQEEVTPTDNGATLAVGVGVGVAAGIFFLVVAAVFIIIVVAVICLKSKKGKVWRFNGHDVLNKTDNYNIDDKVNMEDIKRPEDDKGGMYDVISHDNIGSAQLPAQEYAVVNNRRKPPSQLTQPPVQEYSVLN